MIGLSLNGEFFDLYPNTEISFRKIFPVFSAEVGDNSHSLSFNLPGSVHNERMLGNYQNPQVINSKVIYENITLWFDGLPIEEGSLIIQRSQGKNRSFSARFETGISSVAPILKEAKLVDLDLGGQRDIAGAATALVELSIAFTSYYMSAALQVNGTIYSVYWYDQLDNEGLLNAFANQINADNASIHVDASVSGVGVNAELHLTASAGYTTLEIDINPVGNSYTWTVLSEAAQAVAIHTALISHMNTVATDPIGYHDYCFFPVFNPSFYDGQNPDYLEYINFWDWDTNSFLPNTSSLNEGWRNTAIPFVRVAYLLEKICEFIGYTDISTFTQLDEFQGLCLYNNVSLDQVRNDGSGDFNGFTAFIDLRNHIPEDLTCSDLIIYIRDTFNLSFEVDSQKKTILFYEKGKIPKSTLIDFRSRCLRSTSLSRKREDQRGKTFRYPEDSNDGFAQGYRFQYQDKTFGDGKTIISSDFAPLPVLPQNPNGSLFRWATPVIDQVGKTTYEGVSDGGYNPRSVIYRGIHPGSNALKTYPYGTIGDLDYDGNIIGDFGLGWGTESIYVQVGILERFWLSWLNGREEELEWEQALHLDLEQLLSLKNNHPYRLLHSSGEIDGVVKQLNYTLGSRGIKNVVGTFFKL
jgi:hypothetical protein